MHLALAREMRTGACDKDRAIVPDGEHREVKRAILGSYFVYICAATFESRCG